LYFLFSLSENTIRKYPDRRIKKAINTFHMFMRIKIRSTMGSSDIIRLRQYDSIIKKMAIFIQILPTVFNMSGSLLI